MTRFCPACGTTLEHRPVRAVWCSGGCSQTVHAIGGPAALAESKRIDARIFRAMNGRSSPEAAGPARPWVPTPEELDAVLAAERERNAELMARPATKTQELRRLCSPWASQRLTLGADGQRDAPSAHGASISAGSIYPLDRGRGEAGA